MERIWKVCLMILCSIICTFGICSMANVQAASAYEWTGNTNTRITTDTSIASGLPKSESKSKTYVKWTTDGKRVAGNQSTNAVFLNNRLYWASAGNLYELDKKNGKILRTKKLSHNIGFSYFLTTGGGMLLIQEGMYVEAFDGNLNQKWITTELKYGNQGLTPLRFANGFIYGGTVGVGTDSGCYFCINAQNGKFVWEKRVDDAKLQSCGSSRSYTGFYWAGSAVVDQFLVYGSEGGRLYSVENGSGKEVDTYDTTTDYSNSVRCTILYENGYVYFSTTDGKLYKIPYDNKTGKFGSTNAMRVVKLGEGYSCTSTPTIYNNRLYIGIFNGVEVYNVSGSNLNRLYSMNAKVGSIRDISLVVDAAKNTVYGFSQYYKTPGSIVMFKDALGQTSGKLIDFGTITEKSASQYSASMPTFGPDGTIYISNDSGKLMALVQGKKATNTTKVGIVKPKKQTIKSLKKATKAFTIKWTKNIKATGYQIQYAKNSKFTKKKKTITITKYKTTRKKVKKLSKRCKYYVRVRSYKKVGKVKVYGAWSKTKKVKTK